MRREPFYRRYSNGTAGHLPTYSSASRSAAMRLTRCLPQRKRWRPTPPPSAARWSKARPGQARRYRRLRRRHPAAARRSPPAAASCRRRPRVPIDGKGEIRRRQTHTSPCCQHCRPCARAGCTPIHRGSGGARPTVRTLDERHTAEDTRRAMPTRPPPAFQNLFTRPHARHPRPNPRGCEGGTRLLRRSGGEPSFAYLLKNDRDPLRAAGRCRALPYDEARGIFICLRVRAG
jgi:hypothetical protein